MWFSLTDRQGSSFSDTNFHTVGCRTPNPGPKNARLEKRHVIMRPYHSCLLRIEADDISALFLGMTQEGVLLLAADQTLSAIC